MGWLACFPGDWSQQPTCPHSRLSEGEPSNSASLGTLHILRECEGIRFESGPNGNRVTSFSSFQWPAK